MQSTQCIHVCLQCVCVYIHVYIYTYSMHVVCICSSVYIHIHVYIYTCSIHMQYGVYTAYTQWNIVYMEYTHTHTHTLEYHSAIKKEWTLPFKIAEMDLGYGVRVRAELLCCVRLCDPVDCSPSDSSVRGILREGYWSGSPCPSPGDLPHPGVEPTSHMSHRVGRQVLDLLHHLGSPEGTVLGE